MSTVTEPALEALGDSQLVVALVGCGKAKARLDRNRLPASQLYTGVPFRMAYAHAKETADDVHILSAKHGLVDPSTVLSPYNFSMVQIPPSKHVAWGRRVLADLFYAYPMRRLRIVFYAGQQYVRPILRAVTNEHQCMTFENPLEGLDLFERLRWFKQNTPLQVPF